MSERRGMSVCAHPRCDTPIADHHLACPTHWAGLPTSLRNRIWKWWRHDHGGARHLKAIGEALTIWRHEILESERRPRCHLCKAATDLTDASVGLPVCVTCARAGMSLTSGDTLICIACRRPVPFTIGISDGPDMCADCQIAASAA